MDGLQDIVEVIEVGVRKANEYLANGYRLLAINAVSTWKNPEGPKQMGWVLKFTVYTVGRTADVPQYTPAPREQRPA